MAFAFIVLRLAFRSRKRVRNASLLPLFYKQARRGFHLSVENVGGMAKKSAVNAEKSKMTSGIKGTKKSI